MKQQTITLQDEAWLMRRLKDHGAGNLDDGLTTPDQRRENVRQAVIDRGLTQVVAGGKDGKAVLFPDAFERLYGVPFA